MIRLLPRDDTLHKLRSLFPPPPPKKKKLHSPLIMIRVNIERKPSRETKLCVITKADSSAKIWPAKHIWAATWDFQHCGMCDQQGLYKSLECSRNVKLHTEQHLEFLSLKGGLYKLVWVYTCQNATLLEITCRGLNYVYHTQWLRPLSVLKPLFCCSRFIAYCSSHCFGEFCVWSFVLYKKQYVAFFIVLQSSRWGRESWLLYFNCALTVIWL